MTIKEYQTRTHSTAIYPEKQALEYLILGLLSESGELAGKVKKMIRDKTAPDIFSSDMKYELGDIMWYISELSNLLKFDLEEVLDLNISKLSDRKTRDVLRGSGDNR